MSRKILGILIYLAILGSIIFLLFIFEYVGSSNIASEALDWCDEHRFETFIVGNQSYTVPMVCDGATCWECLRIYSIIHNVTIPEDVMRDACPPDIPPSDPFDAALRMASNPIHILFYIAIFAFFITYLIMYFRLVGKNGLG